MAPPLAYAIPAGFVEVTAENRNLPVSEHFTLGDFLTKDQPGVWPKYLLLDARLVDKLELIIDELEREGYPVEHLAIMSGFRTPRYNQVGGQASGRGKLSRHMYGDATDVFVDNDRTAGPTTSTVTAASTSATRRWWPGLPSASRPATRTWWAASASTAPPLPTGPSPTWTRAGGGPAGGARTDSARVSRRTSTSVSTSRTARRASKYT